MKVNHCRGCEFKKGIPSKHGRPAQGVLGQGYNEHHKKHGRSKKRVKLAVKGKVIVKRTETNLGSMDVGPGEKGRQVDNGNGHLYANKSSLQNLYGGTFGKGGQGQKRRKAPGKKSSQ